MPRAAEMNMIEVVIEVEKIFSDKEGGEVSLQPIVDAILENDNPINVIQMLSLSCEFENLGAQSSYLNIISECLKVFEPNLEVISSFRKSFSKMSVYYYLEFLLGCGEEGLNLDHIEGLVVSEKDLAYPFYKKIVDLSS
jgi:hypothetical protein